MHMLLFVEDIGNQCACDKIIDISVYKHEK